MSATRIFSSALPATTAAAAYSHVNTGFDNSASFDDTKAITIASQVIKPGALKAFSESILPAASAAERARPKNVVRSAGDLAGQKRLFSILQSHITSNAQRSHPNNNAVSGNSSKPVDAIDNKRREIEERLAAKLKAEKEVLQAEVELEEREKRQRKEEAIVKHREAVQKELEDQRMKRERLMRAFLKSSAGSAVIYYLPVVLTDEQEKTLRQQQQDE